MDVFVIVPGIALGCYIILMLVFLSSEKTEATRAFIYLLASYILWNLGSVFMRLGLAPSSVFWFHISACGLFLIPVSLVYFASSYVEIDRLELIGWMGAGSLLLWLGNLISGGLFISFPAPVYVEGSLRYVYRGGTYTFVLFVCFCLILFYADYLLLRYKRKGMLTNTEIILLSMGVLLLVSGNLLMVLPIMDGFPIAQFFGILNALLLFAALQKSRRFKLTLIISRRMYRVLVMTAAFFGMMYMEKPYRNFLEHQVDLPWIQDNLSFIMFGTFLVAYILTFWLIEYFAESVFLKESELQAEGLRIFSSEICQTFDMDTIFGTIHNTVETWLGADWSAICVMEDGCYRTPRGEEAVIKLRFQEDSLPAALLKNAGGCVRIEDLTSREDMDQQSLEQLKRAAQYGIRLLLPIFDGEMLYAILLISGGRKKRNYGSAERDYLDSVASMSAVAIRNAKTYQSAYWEARRDELTGAGNRKYFYEVMGEFSGRAVAEPLSMALLDMDDFKVYNQLYGNEGGDGILRKVAELISRQLNGAGKVFRYGATEFVLVLPVCSVRKAYSCAENIRLKVMNITQGIQNNQMMVTVSCGVSGIGKGQVPDEKLLDQCSLAVYRAKRSGKNCTVIYQENSGQEEIITDFRPGVYSEYAATFLALTAAIDAKDHYTYDHSQNVAYYACELARGLGMNSENVEIAREAGLLHDIGKIGIPESILQKPGRLTDEEYDIMKSHVEQAAVILRHLPSLEYVIPVVLGHHEWYNGKGYPRGLAGSDIPALARVLCIADSFDAMISRRSYKDCYTKEHAMEQLQACSGLQFDPHFEEVFVDLIKKGKIQIRFTE